jgi:hypothetical protein
MPDGIPPLVFVLVLGVAALVCRKDLQQCDHDTAAWLRSAWSWVRAHWHKG